MNPLEKAIAAAVKANNTQKALFGRMGTSDHPRGFALAGYRNARRSMAAALKENQPVEAAREVMTELRSVVAVSMRDLLRQAVDAGVAEAVLQLGYYDIPVPDNASYMDLYSQVDSAANVIGQTIDLQANTIYALISSGESALVLGDDSRLGVLKPGNLLLAGAFWLSTLMWNSFSDVAIRHGKDRTQKQAIAAIDNKTTDCCLRVHGQVVDLDGYFKLSGTPRYADELEWTPFHAWCRTSVALYDRRYDDGLSAKMRSAANTVLDERNRGIYNTRRPADAYG